MKNYIYPMILVPFLMPYFLNGPGLFATEKVIIKNDVQMQICAHQIANLKKELDSITYVRLKPLNRFDPGVKPDHLQKRFVVEKKNSSLTKAACNAKDYLVTKVMVYLISLEDEGYVLVDEPEPLKNISYDWGISGDQYYIQIEVDHHIWGKKTNRKAKQIP
ncbi:MAG: hypothetical protein GY729_14915 [Desulfobacteraceae bacterium]|nr:hypothetical protein [Desulfobacteraceae bacterium]